jgi:hypothetical protein
LVIDSGDLVPPDHVENGVDDFGAIATQRVRSAAWCFGGFAIGEVSLAELVDEVAKDLLFGAEHGIGQEGSVQQPGEVDKNGAGQLADSHGFWSEHFTMPRTAAAVLADPASELVLEEFEGWGGAEHGMLGWRYHGVAAAAWAGVTGWW